MRAAPAEIAAVRRFNRFYTRRIDALARHHLATPFSLAESRVLYELAQGETTARDLVAGLGLDQGYLSRILSRFEARGLIRRVRAEDDGRLSRVALTEAGRATFADLDRAAEQAVAAMLENLAPGERARTVEAMALIERTLGGTAPRDCILREHRPGDVGLIVSRQAALYAEEYGWDGSYEALAAEIGADFLRHYDPARERAWIAERDGAVGGSVFLMRAPDAAPGTAKLRLLYVEPSARGLGLGRRLVDACIAEARRLGYERLTLWTNDVLVAAGRLYRTAGFRLVREEPHHSFGKDLVGQTWELDLRAASPAAAAPSGAAPTASER